MSFSSIVAIANSYDLQQRIKACAATQVNPDKGLPIVQTDSSRWILAASPGWAAAWDSALASNNSSPGSDPTVITDGMILAAVQPFLIARIV